MSGSQRRPYRVIFTRPGATGAVQCRAGTIVAATIHIARREAEHIATTGGTAEVCYVTETGRRLTVERFGADQRPAM